jgi:hypothetical protein
MPASWPDKSGSKLPQSKSGGPSADGWRLKLNVFYLHLEIVFYFHPVYFHRHDPLI